MKKHSGIVAGASAVALVASVVWSTGGSATTASSHHGWAAPSIRSVAADAHQATTAAVQSGGHALTVIEHEVRTAGVDVGDPGDSPGDMFVFESRLRDPQTGHTVGWDSGHCSIIVRTFACEATATFNHQGKIVVSGSFFDEQDFSLAIVGGTGRYHDAAGQLLVLDLPSGDTKLGFLLEE